MIYFDSEYANQVTEPCWLSPDGVEHGVRRFQLGRAWPHREFAEELRPNADDPEKTLMELGWWKCQCSYLTSSVDWVGRKNATKDQQAIIRAWAKKVGYVIKSDDFIAEYDETGKTQLPETVEPTKSVKPPKTVKPVKVTTKKPNRRTITIKQLPIAGAVQADVRVEEVGKRDLCGTDVWRSLRSFAPVAGDNEEEGVHVAVCYALGLHISRSKGKQTYCVHVSLSELVNKIDAMMLEVDAESLPMAVPIESNKEDADE